MGESIILVKSKAFAIRIVKLYQWLVDKKKEFVLVKQLLRSGTSIGANVREAHHAQSKREFVAKMNIALKEAAESEYWLELLFETNYLDKKEFDSINKDCVEIKSLLISIIKSSNKGT